MAVNHVWADLPSINPLLRSLPAAFIKNNPENGLVRIHYFSCPISVGCMANLMQTDIFNQTLKLDGGNGSFIMHLM